MIPKEVLGKYLKPGMVMVETGTGKGEDVITALDLGASTIYTVEVQKELYTATVDELKRVIHNYEEGRRIGAFVGHSSDVLQKSILPHVNEKAVIWLDAYTNYSSAALQEVQTIGKFPVKDHTILVNNVRVFQKGTWIITMEAMYAAFRAINPRYEFEFVNSMLHPNDIMVARIP